MPTIRGVEFAVNDVGEGLPVFWGHGLVGSMEQDEQFSVIDWTFLARRYRIVRWDARGHGKTGGAAVPDDYRWDNHARDLLALADALRIDSFVAGGVSMGAAAAMHAATQAPRRVIGLILALAPTAYETRAEQADLYRAGAVLIERLGADAYVEQLRNFPAPEILAGEYAERYFPDPQVHERLLPSVLRGAAASDLPGPDALRSLTAPALLLPWVGDPGHPLSTSERLVELFHNVQIHVAHQLSDVANWTTRVDSFLAQLEEEAQSA